MDEQQQTHLLKQVAESLHNSGSQRAYPGSAIAYLLHLHTCDLREWRWRWINDMLDVRIEVKGNSVEVFGYVVWGNNGTAGQWTDPLWSEFIRDKQGRIVGYKLQFCDVERASQPYSRHRRHQPTAEINWSYSFEWQARSAA